MTVDTLADALNLRESTLRDLNPALTDIVWSGDKYVPQGFELRVPRDTAAVAEALLGTIDADKLFAAQRADREHRVRRGDTLSKIASEYRVSLAALMRVNGMSGKDVIRVGQMIRLPVDGVTAPPDATLVRAEVPAPAPAPATPALAATSAEGVYVVRSGDSIERIATRLGVDSQALIAANDIRNRNVIQVGQQLIIPNAPGAVVAAEAVAAVSAPPAAVESPVAPAAESPAAVAAEPVAAADLTAALAPAVLANGEPRRPEADEAADDGGGRQRARERARHAGGRPERLHGQHGQPDHRAGARDARPLRRMARDSDAAAARRELAVVPRSRRARPNADARLRAHRRADVRAAAPRLSSAAAERFLRGLSDRGHREPHRSSRASRCGSWRRAPTTCRSGCCANTTPTSISTAFNRASSSSSRA